MRLYFPFPDIVKGAGPMGSKHTGASKDEIKTLRKTARRCLSFVAAANEWEDRNMDEFKQLGCELEHSSMTY